MYLCQELSAVTLQSIAKLFKLQRYGTVSTTVGKLKSEFDEDPKLQAITERLSKQLSKGNSEEAAPTRRRKPAFLGFEPI